MLLRVMAAAASMADRRVDAVLYIAELTSAATRRSVSSRPGCGSASGSPPPCSGNRESSSSMSLWARPIRHQVVEAAPQVVRICWQCCVRLQPCAVRDGRDGRSGHRDQPRQTRRPLRPSRTSVRRPLGWCGFVRSPSRTPTVLATRPIPAATRSLGLTRMSGTAREQLRAHLAADWRVYDPLGCRSPHRELVMGLSLWHGDRSRAVASRAGEPVANAGNRRILEVADILWCTGSAPTSHGSTSQSSGKQSRSITVGVVDNEPGPVLRHLNFLYAMSSGFFPGVGRDAEYVVESIASRN
jgi:hypothetical protein